MNALMIFLGEFGVNQMILVAIVILLLFGGRKIPELMKGLGSGIKEFKKAAKDEPAGPPINTDPIRPSDPAIPPPAPQTSPEKEENL